MGWTLTEGDEGYLLSQVTGHMAEPWGTFADLEKATHILELLEWGEFLMTKGVPVPKPKPKRKRAR